VVKKTKGIDFRDILIYFVHCTNEFVKQTSQNMEKHFDAADRSKLPKVEEELRFLFASALDFWWRYRNVHTKEDRLSWEELFNLFTGLLFSSYCKEEEELLENITIQFLERYNSYVKIIYENKGDKAKYAAFGMKLSEYCDIPNVHFLVIIPSLFTIALETVSKLKPVQ